MWRIRFRERLRPALVLGLPVAAGLALFGRALIGSKVFAPGDLTTFLVPFGPVRPPGLLRPANPGLSDVVTIFEPLLLTARQAIHAGHLPLWSPNAGLGRPLGAQQGAPLFPISWLAYILPFWRSLAWIALAKLTLAFSGAFLLARHHGTGRIAAASAGTAFALSTVFISFLSYSQTDVAAMLPWAMLAADRLPGGGWRQAAVLGLVLGAALYAGHPETWFVLLCGTVAILVARSMTLGRRVGVRARSMLIAAALSLAALVGALYLVPFAELLSHAANATRGGAEPDSLRQLTVGLLFPEWWGRTDKTIYDAHVSLTTASSLFPGRLYLGVAPLLATVGALALPLRRAQRFYLALGALSLALMLDIPGLRTLVTHAPPFSRMDPHYFIWLASLCLAMTGALGLDAILRTSRRHQLRALRAAALFAALVVLVALAFNPRLLGVLPRALGQLPAQQRAPGAELASGGALVRWLVLCAVILLGAWWTIRRPRRTAVMAAAALVVLSGVDLVTMDRGINPVLAPAVAHPPEPPALALAAQGGGRIAGPYSVAAPSLSTLYGIPDVRVSDQPQISRYSDTFSALGAFADFAQGASYVAGVPSFGEQLASAPGARTQTLLELLGARYFIDAGGGRPSAGGVRVAASGPGWRVLQDATAFPRAWIVYDWRPVPGLSADLQVVRSSSAAALRTVPAIETAATPSLSAPRGGAPARVLSAGSEALSVQARLQRPGYLILDDLFYPGWTATVDGRRAAIQPADGLLRAVRVPAGSHLVHFGYHPASVTIGEILTLAGLLIALALLIVPPQARRRGPPRPKGRHAEREWAVLGSNQ